MQESFGDGQRGRSRIKQDVTYTITTLKEKKCLRRRRRRRKAGSRDFKQLIDLEIGLRKHCQKSGIMRGLPTVR